MENTMTLTTLPTIITEPGQYRTRNGKTAIVDRVRPIAKDQPPETFAATGKISHHDTHGGHTTTRATWHTSGRSNPYELRGIDIVGKDD